MPVANKPLADIYNTSIVCMSIGNITAISSSEHSEQLKDFLLGYVKKHFRIDLVIINANRELYMRYAKAIYNLCKRFYFKRSDFSVVSYRSHTSSIEQSACYFAAIKLFYNFNNLYSCDEIDEAVIREAKLCYETIAKDANFDRVTRYEFEIKAGFTQISLSQVTTQSLEKAYAPLVKTIGNVLNDVELSEDQKMDLLTKTFNMAWNQEIFLDFSRLIFQVVEISAKYDSIVNLLNQARETHTEMKSIPWTDASLFPTSSRISLAVN